MGFFKNYFFNLLPTYFHKSDSNKNSDKEGTLNRYLQVLGEDVDAEVVPYIEDFINLLDIETTPSQFINYISYTLGNPPDIFKDEALYRKVLRYVLNIYKIKGTKESYELYFSMLGFNVTIYELPDSLPDRYDDPTILYDIGGSTYDDGCSTCTGYEITFTSNVNPLAPLQSDTLQKLRDIIYFVEPINARLDKLNFGINPIDDVNFCIEQVIKIETLSFLRYDAVNVNYDTIGISYDSSVSSTILNLPLNCTSLLPTEGISIWELENDFEVE